MLKCIKLYLTMFSEREPNFSEREPGSKKMCCINIHLTVNPFTFNKYCIIMLIIMHDCTLSEYDVVQ